MIIKVPLYVEIDKVHNKELPDLVYLLSKVFIDELSEFNFETFINSPSFGRFGVKDMKIISEGEALESLRTKK